MDSSHGSCVGYKVLSPHINGNVYSNGSKRLRMVPIFDALALYWLNDVLNVLLILS